MDKTILINNPQNIWLGKIIKEKYKITKLLGSGASGDVYLCENLQIGNKIVVKIVQKDLCEKFNFTKEIEILAKIHHPNLPYIIDTYQDNQCVYIFETYIEGENLENRLDEKGFLEEKEVIKYFEQLLDILKYLHNLQPNPIIYKDIKPSNIIVNKERKLFAVDFGISRLQSATDDIEKYMSGTKNYAAPEQWNIELKTDIRADIYSLGSLTYKMLVGERFKSNFQKLDIDINISDEFKAIIKKCLIESLDGRYQKIEDIIKDFERLGTNNNLVKSGKKVFLVDGAQGVGKSTIISGLANIYSKENIKTAVLDMSDKLGITLFWDVKKTQLMKYIVDSNEYEVIKKVAIKPNKNLFIYKMSKVGEEGVIIFINKILKFVDVIFVECNRYMNKKIYDYAHDIILVTKQEEKYLYATNYIINKYIKNNVYLDNIKLVANEYIDCPGEEEYILNLLNKRILKKKFKYILKIPSVKRKNYIENLQKGNVIFKNDDEAQIAFSGLAKKFYECEQKANIYNLFKEVFARWHIREEVKK